MNLKQILTILCLVIVLGFFPAAILTYTFIPALAPLIPLKALIGVVLVCALYVSASASALKALFEEMAIRKSASAGTVHAEPADDEISDNKFE